MDSTPFLTLVVIDHLGSRVHSVQWAEWFPVTCRQPCCIRYCYTDTWQSTHFIAGRNAGAGFRGNGSDRICHGRLSRTGSDRRLCIISPAILLLTSAELSTCDQLGLPRSEPEALLVEVPAYGRPSSCSCSLFTVMPFRMIVNMPVLEV
jgi:hypothetical protein